MGTTSSTDSGIVAGSKVYEIWDTRATHARGLATLSLDRLLGAAQLDPSSSGRRVARFLASLRDSSTWPLDLADLSAVDIGVSDDMLVCLDAHRWNKGSLFDLVDEGETRLQASLALHKLLPMQR